MARKTVMMLDVRGLKADYLTPWGAVRAVDGVNLSLAPGEALGIVGDSGSGKSTIAYSIMGYLPPPGAIVAGSLSFRGVDLIRHSRRVRWKQIAMLFQGAMNAMNPFLKVGKQIDEVLKVHTKLNRKERTRRIASLLESVHLDSQCAAEFPHQLSGGMKQRVMLAMALACHPLVLIADEPTTNIDVINQRRIIDLLDQLKQRFRLSLICISHDLGLIARTCQRVIVLEHGRIVESGDSADVLIDPKHPCTRRMVNSLKKISTHEKHIA